MTASALVTTPSGVVRGLAHEGVREFRGIPYGEAPVGERRFRPSVAHGGWTGELDATEFGARARQPGSLLAPAGEPESEDCLFLNVWAPAAPEEPCPVMVWVHGGSFTTGSGALSWYDGGSLARRGVVVVTINYRLGPFGFLHLEAIGGEAWQGSANAGLSDQTLALRWVRDHIAAFGGDPARVTLFGESAGAMSVSTHLALPASAGLFGRAVVQSGAATHVQDPAEAERTARVVLDHLGVREDELERLAEVDADALVAATAAADRAVGRLDLPLPFRPTVDGSTLPVAPLDALRGGAGRDVALLCGTTADEMQLFRLVAMMSGADVSIDEDRLARRVGRAVEWRAASGGASALSAEAVLAAYRAEHPGLGPSDLWSQISTDLTFRLPALRMLDAHHEGGGAGWRYLFTHRSTAFDGSLGACHALEIPFVFDNLDQRGTAFLIGEIDGPRRSLATAMADAWVAFARGEDPGAATLPTWPRYEPATRATMVLDATCEVVDDPGSATRRAWGPT